jgi:hypothetical protein
MLSIDVISCDHRLHSIRRYEEVLYTRLDKNISDVLERTLSPISALVPMPMLEQVVIHRFVVYQDVFHELRRIVIEEIAECFNDLSDNGGEVGIVFRQILRETDEGVERPSLLSCE